MDVPRFAGAVVSPRHALTPLTKFSKSLRFTHFLFCATFHYHDRLLNLSLYLSLNVSISLSRSLSSSQPLKISQSPPLHLLTSLNLFPQVVGEAGLAVLDARSGDLLAAAPVPQPPLRKPILGDFDDDGAAEVCPFSENALKTEALKSQNLKWGWVTPPPFSPFP